MGKTYTRREVLAMSFGAYMTAVDNALSDMKHRTLEQNELGELDSCQQAGMSPEEAAREILVMR